MEFDLKDLAKRINKMDSYYEYSDDYRRIVKGTDEENAIAHWLNGLDDSEIKEVINLLDKDGIFNYKRYFKDKWL